MYCTHGTSLYILDTHIMYIVIDSKNCTLYFKSKFGNGHGLTCWLWNPNPWKADLPLKELLANTELEPGSPDSPLSFPAPFPPTSPSVCLCGFISKEPNRFRTLPHCYLGTLRTRDSSYWEINLNTHTAAVHSPSLFLIKGPADTLHSSLGSIPSTTYSPICPQISPSCLFHWHSHPHHQTVFIYSPPPSLGNDVRH